MAGVQQRRKSLASATTGLMAGISTTFGSQVRRLALARAKQTGHQKLQSPETDTPLESVAAHRMGNGCPSVFLWMARVAAKYSTRNL